MWAKKGAMLVETDMFSAGAEAIFTLSGAGDMLDEKIRAAFAPLAVCRQVHGNAILRAEAAAEQPEPAADGLFTDEKSIALGVKCADCAAVYLFSPKEKKIALVHAGRRGVQSGIVEKAAALFDAPETIVAAVGPHIKKCCYTVGSDAGLPFGEFFSGGRLDLTGAILSRLKKSGIPRETVSVAGFCTACAGADFFSHRRSHDKRRHLAVLRII